MLWFQTRSDSIQTVQRHNMARNPKFWIKFIEEFIIPVVKTKALICEADMYLCFSSAVRKYRKSYCTHPALAPALLKC